MDVVAVEAARAAPPSGAGAAKGPVLLELRTYRFRAHSMFDPELYRDKAEVDEWKQRDPITTFTAQLKARGLTTDAVVAGFDRTVAGEIDRAVQFAEVGTWEPVEDLLKDVYTPAEPRHASTSGAA